MGESPGRGLVGAADFGPGLPRTGNLRTRAGEGMGDLWFGFGHASTDNHAIACAHCPIGYCATCSRKTEGPPSSSVCSASSGVLLRNQGSSVFKCAESAG